MYVVQNVCTNMSCTYIYLSHIKTLSDVLRHWVSRELSELNHTDKAGSSLVFFFGASCLGEHIDRVPLLAKNIWTLILLMPFLSSYNNIQPWQHYYILVWTPHLYMYTRTKTMFFSELHAISHHLVLNLRTLTSDIDPKHQQKFVQGCLLLPVSLHYATDQ